MDYVEMVKVAGAGYGAIQAICQFLMLILPSKTLVWKAAKYLTSGPARPADGNIGGMG